MANTTEAKMARLMANTPDAKLAKAYINSAETALKALGGYSALREKLESIKPYQSELDRILKTGINSTTAWDMLQTHKTITDNLRVDFRSYEQTTEEPDKTDNQLVKELEQKDRIIQSKENEIAELKALLTKGEKQEKDLEKQTRNFQNHALIWKIDQSLEIKANGKKPTAIEVWNELERNHDLYDGEDGEDPIIRGVTDGTI